MTLTAKSITKLAGMTLSSPSQYVDKEIEGSSHDSVSCARHQLFQLLGVGDLQKGERYVMSFC